MSTTAESKTKVFQFTVPASGIRLDKYVAEALPQYSRSYVHKLILQGHVLVNGQKAKASQRLKENDGVEVEIPPSPTHPIAEPIPLTIIYEDEDIVVLNKPAGLTVHPAPGHSCHTLVNAILAHCPQLATSNDLVRPGIVHRLDKDTSGLIVIAKNDFARSHLVDQFKSHTITKGYFVLVRGKLSPEKGTIEGSIGRDPHNRQKMAVVATGKEASTRYQVRRYLGNYTLIEVIPLTGRTHQIRVHLSAIGYPVVGDPVYGTKSDYLKRQFIHAYRLGFHLPATNEYREFTCDLPHDLEEVLELLAHNA